jgi:hypothetical protein
VSGEGGWSNQVVSLIILTEAATGFSGLFGYSPTPGAGNLILSVAAAAGTDPYGNAYQAGVTSYLPSGQFTQLQAGILQVSPAAIGSGYGGNIDTLGAGQAVFNSGGTSVADTNQGSVSVNSQGANILSDGLSSIILSANEVALNESFSSTIPHAHVTGLPLSVGSSLAQTVAAVNNLYAALQDVRVIAP